MRVQKVWDYQLCRAPSPYLIIVPYILIYINFLNMYISLTLYELKLKLNKSIVKLLSRELCLRLFYMGPGSFSLKYRKKYSEMNDKKS